MVHFRNTTIEIQGKNYYNEEKITSKPLPTLLQPLSKSSTVEEILSLQMLHQLNTNNTKYINTLEKEEKIVYGISFSFTILAIIIMIAIGKCIFIRGKGKIPQLTPVAIEGLNQLFNNSKPSNEDIRNLEGE